MLGGIGVALAFGYAWSWVMAVVGLLVRTAEAVQAAVYIVVFPLGFTSAVLRVRSGPDYARSASRVVGHRHHGVHPGRGASLQPRRRLTTNLKEQTQ